MTVPTTFMVDTIGSNADALPLHLPAYCGYVSGLDGVEWTPEQFARFTGSKVFKLYQGIGPVPPVHTFDGIDIESRAVTPQQAASITAERVAGGIPWTTFYGSDSALAQASIDTQALGTGIWVGHVNCILADWNLDETQAAALVGTSVHGMTCVGVQWASPETNLDTFIPGTNLTLSQANADLSVIDANWVPSGGFTPSPGPVPVPTPHLSALLIRWNNGFVVNNATSTDDGQSWHI